MKRSAGILLYKFDQGRLRVLLVHPGGPFWTRKDLGAWSVPKGGYEKGDDPLDAAIREFSEETGGEVQGPFRPLGDIVQRNKKIVSVWAVEGDFDPATLKSNHCEIEWPPRSGKMLSIPEVDRAEWFSPEVARQKINPGQAPLIDRLESALAAVNK